MSNENDGWDSELNGRERLFVLNYCTDSLCFFNGTQAYKAAYTKTKGGMAEYIPDDDTAAVGASKLLRKAKVKKAVKDLLSEMQPDIDKENSHRLLHDLVLQATYNPADIIDRKGRLKVSELSELGELAKCIDQIYMTQTGTRIVLSSRRFAQDKLLKYYNLVCEKPEIKVDLPVIAIAEKADNAAEWNRDNAGEEEHSVEASAETGDGSQLSGD